MEVITSHGDEANHEISSVERGNTPEQEIRSFLALQGKA